MQKFDFKSWYKKWTSPKSSQDLTAFIENLPQKAGTTVLAVAGIAWFIAGLAILYGNMQSERISELRKELMQTESLTPPVPIVSDVKIDADTITAFAESASEEYATTGISIKENKGKIEITGKSGRQYGVFREAVGHIQNGGKGWRVSVDELCVGRGCLEGKNRSKSFLHGVFSVSKVKVEMPRT